MSAQHQKGYTFLLITIILTAGCVSQQYTPLELHAGKRVANSVPNGSIYEYNGEDLGYQNIEPPMEIISKFFKVSNLTLTRTFESVARVVSENETLFLVVGYEPWIVNEQNLPTAEEQYENITIFRANNNFSFIVHEGKKLYIGSHSLIRKAIDVINGFSYSFYSGNVFGREILDRYGVANNILVKTFPHSDNITAISIIMDRIMGISLIAIRFKDEETANKLYTKTRNEFFEVGRSQGFPIRGSQLNNTYLIVDIGDYLYNPRLLFDPSLFQ